MHMDLTLNIIEHELQPYGHVVRSCDDNVRVSGFRLFEGGYAGARDQGGEEAVMLYLCGTREDAERACRTGLAVAYVNPSGTETVDGAALSVLGGSTLLVVLNALLDVAAAFDRWERRMDEVRLSGGSLQDLLDVSSPFLRNNVVVLDAALKLLAYSRDVPCDDQITMELISHGYHTEENISKFKLHKRFEPWGSQDGFVVNDTLEICKYVTVVRSFKTRSSFSLIIVMMCNVVEPHAWLLDLYDVFAKQVEYYALRDYPEDKPSGNATDTFLKDLFTNGLDDPAVVAERCKLVGIPFDAHFCVFCLKSEEGSVPESRLLSDVSRLVAPAKTVLVDGMVAVLCFNCRNGECARRCALDCCTFGGRSLSVRLDEMLVRYGIPCGRSAMFSQLSDAAVAFAQAREALSLLTAGRVQPTCKEGNGLGRIVTFDDCVIEYLADALPESAKKLVGATYASSIIEAIADYDEQSNTDNYRFLYEYLLHERRTSEVADVLHMHRNNVKYRIDRIGSQFGIDVSDPAARFELLLAFRMRDAALKL